MYNLNPSCKISTDFLSYINVKRTDKMNTFTLIIIALGLAMDAFAVAVASGITIKKQCFQHALRIAFYFGGFQAFMPVLGWIAGIRFQKYITAFDHWIAFGLLAFIGIKMIVESYQIDPEKKQLDRLTHRWLFILAIATSIDALAVGLTFAVLNISLIKPVLIIGGITFVTSFAGVYIGDHFGHFFEKRIERIGGLILIGIGIKILIEHMGLI